MNDTKIASKAKARLAHFMGKVFTRFLKPARKGGPTSVSAFLRTARGFGAHQKYKWCAPEQVLVRTKIFLDQHQNHFRPAPKSF